MEKVFVVKGLDCAMCAQEFEEKVNKIEGVKKATMNFISGKLFVEGEYSEDKLNEVASKFEDGLTLKRIK